MFNTQCRVVIAWLNGEFVAFIIRFAIENDDGWVTMPSSPA